MESDGQRHDSVSRLVQRNPIGPGQDDVVALLRRTADAIDALGDVEILDLVMHQFMAGPDAEDRPSIVLYYRAPPPSAGSVSRPGRVGG